MRLDKPDCLAFGVDDRSGDLPAGIDGGRRRLRNRRSHCGSAQRAGSPRFACFFASHPPGPGDHRPWLPWAVCRCGLRGFLVCGPKRRSPAWWATESWTAPTPDWTRGLPTEVVAETALMDMAAFVVEMSGGTRGHLVVDRHIPAELEFLLRSKPWIRLR